jgi:hypothetical protein
MTTENLGAIGEITAAFGAAFSDGQTLLDTLANQNAQWNVTQAPAVWSQTASVLGLVVTEIKGPG